MWTTRNIPNQTGKIVIITGANTGIGYETAFALYNAGAHVVLACRDVDKAEAAKNKMAVHNGKGSLETACRDLGDLKSVQRFADEFSLRHKQLNVLINNAGVANTGVNAPFEPKTVDGYEQQFGINFLGHFALTGRLYSILRTTSLARIITVSSMGYQGAIIDFDN